MMTDAEIEAELAELRDELHGFETGKLSLGSPFDGRAEQKIFNLRHRIAELEKRRDKKI